MSDEKRMNLAEYLTFIRENLDGLYVRFQGKTVRLSDVPTDEALQMIYAWWVMGVQPHVVRNVD